MTTYVLIHGAWSGAFSFRRVRQRLQAEGHEVFTPSLTGIGDRVHLASPQVTLRTHVQDVVNLIQFEDLRDIVLLGYSYGGAVVTGCLDHIGDRVAHLVYLDAFVPQDGQAVIDLVGQPRPPMTLTTPAYMPPAPRSYDDPAEAEFQNARRVPQPLGTLLEPVRLAGSLEAFPFTRTYIRATGSAATDVGNNHFAEAAAHAKQSAAWGYHELASNHMVMSNVPDDVSALLLDIGG